MRLKKQSYSQRKKKIQQSVSNLRSDPFYRRSEGNIKFRSRHEPVDENVNKAKGLLRTVGVKKSDKDSKVLSQYFFCIAKLQ